MTDSELYSLLNRAVEHLNKNDMTGFREIMRSAQAHGCASEALQGEMLLLSVAGGEVAFCDRLDVLRQAEKKIGGSSRILSPRSRFAENHYDFYVMWGREPGRADEVAGMGDYIRQTTEVFQHMTGFGRGIFDCYLAQLAYYRGDFEQAVHLANGLLGPNNPCGQKGLLSVYMLELLMGVGKHTLNQELWSSSYNRLRSLAADMQPANRSCREQAEVVYVMQDMSLGCLHDVPGWIRTGDFGVIPIEGGYEIISDRLLTGTIPSAFLAYTQYLSYSDEPARALQAAAMVQQLMDVHSVVFDAYMGMLRAGCYFNLGKEALAHQAIREAMEFIVPDGLWLIAAEFVSAFGEAVYAAAREYGGEAAAKIQSIGEGYWEKLAPLRNNVLRGSTASLTRREQEVADLVMKGHSNAEIAAQLKVSVRTVKYHLENVYQKLNITRRSKFVGDIEQNGGPKLANWVK